jgi:hypothetical protein
MLYMRFTATRPNTWTATSVASKPIAKVTRKAGECECSVTAGRAVSRAELACLSLFMEEREQQQVAPF